MKLFQYHSNSWREHRHQHHYQFLIIKDIVLLHLIYEVDNPFPYNGISIITKFFAPSSLLAPSGLFGAEVQVKGYSWSFWLLSNYWRD